MNELYYQIKWLYYNGGIPLINIDDITIKIDMIVYYNECYEPRVELNFSDLVEELFMFTSDLKTWPFITKKTFEKYKEKIEILFEERKLKYL